MQGFLLGMSFFLRNFGFATLFYVGTIILWETGGEYESMWVAILVIFFGAMGAGQTAQFGPQISKALQAA